MVLKEDSQVSTGTCNVSTIRILYQLFHCYMYNSCDFNRWGETAHSLTRSLILIQGRSRFSLSYFFCSIVILVEEKQAYP